MQFYHSGDFTAETKDDDSPVTSADIAANDIIMACIWLSLHLIFR